MSLKPSPRKSFLIVSNHYLASQPGSAIHVQIWIGIPHLDPDRVCGSEIWVQIWIRIRICHGSASTSRGLPRPFLTPKDPQQHKISNITHVSANILFYCIKPLSVISIRICDLDLEAQIPRESIPHDPRDPTLGSLGDDAELWATKTILIGYVWSIYGRYKFALWSIYC